MTDTSQALPPVEFDVDDYDMFVAFGSKPAFYFSKLKCPQYPDGSPVTDPALIRERVTDMVADGEDVMCLHPYSICEFVGLPDEFWEMEDESDEQAAPLAEGIAEACLELFVDESVPDVALATINGRPFVVSGGPEKTPVITFLHLLDTFGMFERDFDQAETKPTAP